MKKGFTLVELLAVFSLMAVIALLSIPAITGMLKSIDETKNKTFEQNIFLAAEAYISDNRDKYLELKTANVTTYVRIENLLNTYLNSNLINPKTKKQIRLENSDDSDNMLVLVYMNSQNIYEYKLLYLDQEKEQITDALKKIEILLINNSNSQLQSTNSAINSISIEEVKTALQNRVNYNYNR